MTYRILKLGIIGLFPSSALGCFSGEVLPISGAERLVDSFELKEVRLASVDLGPFSGGLPSLFLTRTRCLVVPTAGQDVHFKAER